MIHFSLDVPDLVEIMTQITFKNPTEYILTYINNIYIYTVYRKQVHICISRTQLYHWNTLNTLARSIQTDRSMSAADDVTGEQLFSLKCIFSRVLRAVGSSNQGLWQGISVFFWQNLPYMPPLRLPGRFFRGFLLPRGVCSIYGFGGDALLGPLWSFGVRLICEDGGCGMRNMGLP